MNKVDSYKKAVEFWKGELNKPFFGKEYKEFIVREIKKWEDLLRKEEDRKE